jgi:hypothetical protein
MKLELVDDWRRSWRWASVRLGWFAALVGGFLTAYPDQLKGLVAYVPDQWRPLASLGVAVLIGGVPWLLRVTKKVPADG